MKRVRTIRADDGHGHKISIKVAFESTNSLTPFEIAKVTTEATRHVADAIRNLSYTDFGPDNTIVR